MPKVSINKKRYKLNALKAWIVGQMKLHGMTQKDIGEALGLEQSAVSDRLKIKKTKSGKPPREDPFSYGDLLTLCELFEVEGEEKQRLLTM